MKKYLLYLLCVLSINKASAQSSLSTDNYTLLKPDRVFDGKEMHNNWWVLVNGRHIMWVGEAANAKPPVSTKVIELKGTTLMPGMIEGHSHMFLHPYNETLWNDQVLVESRAERTARAVNHVKATLMAGFTSARDLGTEGAMYDDVGLKDAIEKGIIPGPRLMVATGPLWLPAVMAPKVLTTKPRKAFPKALKKPMVSTR